MGPLFFDFDITQKIEFHVTDSNSNSASVLIYFDKEKPVTPIVPGVPGMPMLTSTIIPVAFDRMYFSGEHNLLYGTVNPSQHGQIQLDQGPEIGTVTEFFPSTWQANLQQAAVWLSQLRISGRASDIIDVVAKQFNEITDLSPEVPYNVPTIYASMKYRARKMPVSLVSSGINKFISLIIAIKTQRSGVLLIDEIENGMYYKGFQAFWEALHRFSIDNNAQLFVSTHSWECLKAAAEVNEKFPDDFSLVQLSQEGGISTARNVKGEDAANAIEHGIEVRG